MSQNSSSSSVDEMLRNVELRSELEPFYDETLSRVNIQHWTLRRENDYLASMLRWEKAPVLPIWKWFNPPMELPSPSQLSDSEITELLPSILDRFYEKRIVLYYTDHLSDRRLYEMILRSILPCSLKKLDDPETYHHWDCSWDGDAADHAEVWLTYYASEEERESWACCHHQDPPPRLLPLHHRDLPRDPQFD